MDKSALEIIKVMGYGEVTALRIIRYRFDHLSQFARSPFDKLRANG